MVLSLFFLLFTAVPYEGINCKSISEEFYDTLHRYKEELGLSYRTSTKKVMAERLRAYKRTKRIVDRVNEDASVPFMAEMNLFSVLTPQEQALYYGVNMTEARQDNHRQGLRLSSDRRTTPISDTVDWTAVGAVPPVRYQGNCGACWAFSAISSVEGAYFLATGQQEMFSEQEILDCTYEGIRDGCRGGWMIRALNYIVETGRLSTRSETPYLKMDRLCNYGNTPNGLVNARISGYVEGIDDADLMANLAKGIVSAAVALPKTFKVYKSGIFSDVEGCNGGIKHAISVVGYGVDEGLKFWKVRNSWGKSWGEGGYIRMSRDDANNCKINNFQIRAVAECREEVYVTDRNRTCQPMRRSSTPP